MSGNTEPCQFQQHAWKKDICANCSRSRSLHFISSIPQPVKRQTKPPEKKITDSAESCSDAGLCSNISQKMTIKQNVTEDLREREICAVVTSSSKPSPIKAKPCISLKPEKARKPVVAFSSNEERVNLKVNADVKLDDTPHEFKEDIKNKSRPEILPPDIPNEDCETGKPAPSIPRSGNETKNNQNMNTEVFQDKRKSASHYYQIYDVSAKGLSGAPENFVNDDCNQINLNYNSLLRNVCRIVEPENEQHVAMPYTVVDVTVGTLERNRLDKPPPQLPSTPAPDKNHFSLTCSASKSTTLQVESSSISQRNNKSEGDNIDEIESSELGFSTAIVRKPRLYEDIDDIVESLVASSADNLSNSLRQSVIKSSTVVLSSFEAKQAALSNLAIQKIESKKGDTMILKAEQGEAKSSGLIRQDKARKSGGKSFFQKLLGRGNKEKEINLDSNKSCGNNKLPIEPVSQISDTSSASGTQSPMVTKKVSQQERLSVLHEVKDRLAKRQQQGVGVIELITHATSSEQKTCSETMMVSVVTDKTSNLQSGCETSLDSKELQNEDQEVVSKLLTSNYDEKESMKCDSVALDQIERVAMGRTSLPPVLVSSVEDVQDCSITHMKQQDEENKWQQTKECSSLATSDSSKRKSVSHVEERTSKTLRKMMIAPPPPPPVIAAISTLIEEDITSLPKLCSNPPAQSSVEPGDDMLTDFRKFPAHSNTLPRSIGSSISQENKLLVGGPRKFDPAAKHSRNMTVSGAHFDEMKVALDSLQICEDQMRDLNLEKRTSKFMNRALPDPPSIPPDNANNCEDIDNLYELVSQSETKEDFCEKERLMYEDIDLYFDSSDKTESQASEEKSSSSSHKSSQPCSIFEASNNLYLEPVCNNEDSLKEDWRPQPAPRGTHSISNTSNQEQSSMSYVNTKVVGGQLMLNLSEGFDAITTVNLNLLHSLIDQLHTVQIHSSDWSKVVFSDIVLNSKKALLSHQNYVFFQALHSTIAPDGCLLMVNDGCSITHAELTHTNLINPLQTFSSSSSVFDHSFPSSVVDVQVLPCISVTKLEVFWNEERAQSPLNLIEQSVCYNLAQILGALLYLHDCRCHISHVTSDNILMLMSLDKEWFPVITTDGLIFDTCNDVRQLCDDVLLLMLQMLGNDDRMETSWINPSNQFTRGLQRLMRLFQQQQTWEGLEKGRNLLEFLLWGPAEVDAKIAAMNEKRDIAFRVWLEVSRCKMVSDIVLMSEKRSLETLHHAQFLCRINESSLLDVTKILFL